MELVSIIMPTYNCGLFIADSIRSVISQTYTNWELIIVDDCSTDNTEQIVRGFNDTRIHYLQNEQNSGAAITRNNALRAARGRYIAFLDSDDLWAKDKLEKQIGFMQQHRYAFTYHQYIEIDDNSNPTGVVVSGPKHVTKAGMYAFCWPGCLTVMYDASQIGLIHIEDIKKNNDYAMWLKVIQKADCYLLNENLAQYRRGRIGSVSNHGILTMIGWHYKLWNEAEKKGVISSVWFTSINIICGLYKKIKYVRHI